MPMIPPVMADKEPKAIEPVDRHATLQREQEGNSATYARRDVAAFALRSGQTVGTKLASCVWVAFERGEFQDDPLLVRFGAGLIVDEMRKVFFSDEPNLFGHSYRSRLCGPQGRCDLSDVIDLLHSHPMSKRALVTLMPSGDGSVPCINAIQFLCREDGLLATYFSRGQDIFRKFYADAVCVYEMAQQVASGLGTRVRSSRRYQFGPRLPGRLRRNSPPFGRGEHCVAGVHAE